MILISESENTVTNDSRHFEKCFVGVLDKHSREYQFYVKSQALSISFKQANFKNTL